MSDQVVRYQATAGSALAPAEEGQLYGEPEWMPSPQEVARARTDMERRGIVASIARGPASQQLVAAGETPWAWLLGAVAWVIVWPAIIALRLGSRQLTWLPWWLPLVLAALHMLALAGPVWLAMRDTGRDALRRRFARVQTVAQMLALNPDEFETWVGMLFILWGYQVKNTQYSGDHGIDLEVTGNGMRYAVVQCKRYRGTVGEPVVRDLYGTMTAERAEHAWLATTGGLSRQAREWATGKPIELWDGQKLVELARKYR
jgi:restriction system protein